MHRKAIIYRPSKNAMQSGCALTHQWVLAFLTDDRKEVDPIMGWISSRDTSRQLNIFFPTQHDAENYARENGIAYEVRQPHDRAPKPKSYSANFSFNKRQYTDITPKNKNASA